MSDNNTPPLNFEDYESDSNNEEGPSPILTPVDELAEESRALDAALEQEARAREQQEEAEQKEAEQQLQQAAQQQQQQPPKSKKRLIEVIEISSDSESDDSRRKRATHARLQAKLAERYFRPLSAKTLQENNNNTGRSVSKDSNSTGKPTRYVLYRVKANLEWVFH
jgi:type II secretory pathway pseudopilin PulG